MDTNVDLPSDSESHDTDNDTPAEHNPTPSTPVMILPPDTPMNPHPIIFLPAELLDRCLYFLPVRDLLEFRLTNKAYRIYSLRTVFP